MFRIHFEKDNPYKQVYTDYKDVVCWEYSDFTKRTAEALIEISQYVRMVSVDGDVRRVQSMFSNLPLINQGYSRKSVTYHGGFAKFIVANMVPY